MDYPQEINKLITCWNHQERINWNDYFMSIALLASSRSPCQRLKVGCVIVKENRILSSGYNGFLPGFQHESIVVDNHEQATVHSEQNAVCYAAKHGINIRDSCIYISHYPCINCFKVLVSAGIKKIYYFHDYKNDPIIPRINNKFQIELVCLKKKIIVESDFTIEDVNSPTLDESMLLEPVKLIKTDSDICLPCKKEVIEVNNEEISSESYFELGKHLSDSESSLN